MDSLFWSRLHGGATHFPIAFIFGSALFDSLGFFLRESATRRNFNAMGYWLVILAALGSVGAVISGLLLSKGVIGGSGMMLRHHLFVWPSFAFLVGLGTWRWLVGDTPSHRAFTIYLLLVGLTCLLVTAAGFFGGEMLLGK